MTEEEDTTRFLEALASHLRTLGDDATSAAELCTHEQMGREGGALLAGAVNYLFRSLDLIPDGIDDIGYLDDAFVLRIAAELALEHAPEADDAVRPIIELAEEASLVREILGETGEKFEAYVKGLPEAKVRERKALSIIDDEGMRAAWMEEVRGFASSYEAPSFAAEEKNLIKLRSFLEHRLS